MHYVVYWQNSSYIMANSVPKAIFFEHFARAKGLPKA